MNSEGWAQVVTWILVIAGWLIVNYQQNERETRKDIRAKLDSLCKKLEQIESNAYFYHTSTRDMQLGLQIRRSIQRLWPEIERLDLISTDTLNRLVVDIRRSITLENFDSRDHTVLGSDHDILAKIASGIGNLESLLEKNYSKRYFNRHRSFIRRLIDF